MEVTEGYQFKISVMFLALKKTWIIMWTTYDKVIYYTIYQNHSLALHRLLRVTSLRYDKFSKLLGPSTQPKLQ